MKIPDSSLGEKEYNIAFLKDTWADDSQGFEIEGEVMVELVESGVKFVSDIFCQGDVPEIEGDLALGEKHDGPDASQYIDKCTLSYS